MTMMSSPVTKWTWREMIGVHSGILINMLCKDKKQLIQHQKVAERVCVCLCASVFHEESKKERALFCSLHCVWEEAGGAPRPLPQSPTNSHTYKPYTHGRTHIVHISPHHTSILGVQVLIPSVSMVSGGWGSVWCQAVASTSLTPSLHN